MHRKCLPWISASECSADGKSVSETELMWSQMGECWLLLKFGCEAEVGNESLRGVESKEPEEEAQVMFDILTPCYATELEHNPNVLVVSIPQFVLLQPGRNLGF